MQVLIQPTEFGTILIKRSLAFPRLRSGRLMSLLANQSPKFDFLEPPFGAKREYHAA
jgi:hypothetical protein